MDKQTVIDHFGSPRATAEYLGITQQAVGQWPELLTERVENRILAAFARKGKTVPSGWLPKPENGSQPCSADQQQAA